MPHDHHHHFLDKNFSGILPNNNSKCMLITSAFQFCIIICHQECTCKAQELKWNTSASVTWWKFIRWNHKYWDRKCRSFIGHYTGEWFRNRCWENQVYVFMSCEQYAGHNHIINMGICLSESPAKFKYLGTQMKTKSMKKLRTKLNSGESLLPFGTESVILFAIKNTISYQLSYNPRFMLKIIDLISLLSAEYGLL